MNHYKLPDGQITHDPVVYEDAWRCIVEEFIQETGWKLVSFNPNFTFFNGIVNITLGFNEAKSWSNVISERNKLRSEVESLRVELALAHSFHDVAIKERDLLKTKLSHVEADSEQAVHYIQQDSGSRIVAALEERNEARSERDTLKSKTLEYRKLIDDCKELLSSQFDPEDNIVMINKIKGLLGEDELTEIRTVNDR